MCPCRADGDCGVPDACTTHSCVGGACVTAADPSCCDTPSVCGLANRCGRSGSCVCVPVVGGGTECIQDAPCSALVGCATSADCPPGQACDQNNCCGFPQGGACYPLCAGAAATVAGVGGSYAPA